MSSRNPLCDTSPEAEEVLIRLIRAKPPEERLRSAFEASNRVARQCKDAIRRSRPELSNEEVKLKFIELNYGPELAAEVRDFLANRDG